MNIYTTITQTINDSDHIVVIQADNPDGDSLGSALALESILTALGKKVSLYCGAAIPTYLRYLQGWDRVSDLMPVSFDVAIVVDTQSLSLLDNLKNSASYSYFIKKPVIIIDHHTTDSTIDFTDIILNDPNAVATSEIIYELAAKNDWPMDVHAKTMIASAILSDSLGLMTEATTARSIHIMGELVEGGVSLAELDNARRELSRKSAELISYKGRLLQRIEFHANNQIATVDIPWEEIVEFSPLYNPSMLVIDEMRHAEGTHIAIAFKQYNDGRITAKIRANYGIKIANKLAEEFGGGGHPYAAGFKVQGKSLAEVKRTCIATAIKLLDALELNNDTTVRYTF